MLLTYTTGSDRRDPVVDGFLGAREIGAMMIPSTRRPARSATYCRSLAFCQLELHSSTPYPASRAASSTPPATSGKKGFLMSGTMRPMVIVRRVTRPRAIALGR